MAFWGRKDLWIHKTYYKKLEELADEIGTFTRKQIDVDDLGSAIIKEFLEIHYGETSRTTARILTGLPPDPKEEQIPTIKFFR